MLSLANAILKEDLDSVRQILQFGEDVNQIDEYGFTPLIEAAIVENVGIAEFLIANGANPNQQDVTGGTPLHWAAENNNLKLTKLLLKHHADPNAYNLAGQPVLVMPTLRRNTALKQLLVRAGADEMFAYDYINTKLLGHMFELVGTADIIDPHHEFVEVDFEGFYLEVTLGLIADSLHQFQNHFAARQLRRFAGLAQYIYQVMQRASQLIRYQQYRVDLSQVDGKINQLLSQEPWLIPVGYEGHAITFIKFKENWIKCDRREDSRLYDNVMFYRINNSPEASIDFVKNLIYQKQSDEFINTELDRLLALEPFTELKVEAQISGNCSWANVEAVIPSLFFLVLMEMNRDAHSFSHYKNLALDYFHKWQHWNKQRALSYCIQRFYDGNEIRKASNAEILAAILFQRSDPRVASDQEQIEKILAVFKDKKYRYILKNYLRIYYFESMTEEGRRFAELLRQNDLYD